LNRRAAQREIDNVNSSSDRKYSKRSLALLVPTLAILVALLASRGVWMKSHPASPAARQIQSREVSERIAALRDLARFGPEDPEVAIPALTAGLKDTDPGIRAGAATALITAVSGAGITSAPRGEMKRAVTTLFENLDDREAEVRAASSEALWMIANLARGSEPPIDLARLDDRLKKAVADPDARVRLSAVRGLGVVSPRVSDDPPHELTRALQDDAGKVRAASALALLQFREGLPHVLPSLVRSYEKARPEMRGAYAAILEGIRPRAFPESVVPDLAKAMESPDDDVRRLAATALGAFGGAATPALPALASGMTRPCSRGNTGPTGAEGPDPALAAAQAILQITPQRALPRAQPRPPIDPRMVPQLAKILSGNDGASAVRASVASTLGRFRPTPAIVSVLGSSAGDSDPAVRAAALWALHDIGDEMPFVPPATVGAALEDQSPQVRLAAAAALGHAGRGIDPFIPRLLHHAEHDADPEVRSVCSDEIEDWIKAAAVTTAVIPILTEALDSRDRRVPIAACTMLARLGPASAPAIPALIRLLRQRGKDAQDDAHRADRGIGRAATALAEIAPGTPSAGAAVGVLNETLHAKMTEADTLAVIKALVRFGPLADDAIRRLHDLEHAPQKVVSESARKTLASIGSGK
jgi:HEAT repeat protein